MSDDCGMLWSLNIWELLLLVAVSLQVTVMAYLRAPRMKALVLCLPLPFTLVSLAMGAAVDATNLLGVIAIFVYVHLVRLLHQKGGVPIVAAIALSLVSYCALGWTLLRLVPATPAMFWILAAVLLAGAAYLNRGTASRSEPGHRTPLPIWLKLPIVLAVVCGLLAVKESLQGVATMFPMVSVPGAYEARHSLWTLGRQMPVLIITLVSLMIVARLSQPHLGLIGGLGLGWIVYLSLLVPLLRSLWARQRETVSSEGLEP